MVNSYALYFKTYSKKFLKLLIIVFSIGLKKFGTPYFNNIFYNIID